MQKATHTWLIVGCIAIGSTLSGCANAPSVSPASGHTADPAGVDRTVDVQAVAGLTVISATEVEPGRIEVKTTIVDPKGPDGSNEAQSAIAICQAVQTLTAAPHVTIFEADGSSFILYGHPTYGDACTEV